MVKVHYTYNRRIVPVDVYEASSTLYDFRSINMEPFESLELTCHLQNQFPSSTTTTTIVEEEEEPIVNEAPPNNNNDNENVAAVVNDRPRGRIPPVQMIEHIIGECSPPFVKQLTQTDVTNGQGRLTLHKDFVNLHLIPMFNDDEDLNEGIDVTLYDSEGREYDMTFKLWTKKLYVLTKGWKEFFYANNLTEAGEYVSVWMFRHVENHKLCFVIIRGNAEEN